MNPYWSYVLTAVGVFGLYLAGRKNYWGWAVGLGAQGLWIAYAYATSQPGFYLSALAYGSVYAKNLCSWRRERMEEHRAAIKNLYSRRKVQELKFCRCGNYVGEHPFPGCPDDPPRECAASISGSCLQFTHGFPACDVLSAECVEAGRPAKEPCGWFTGPDGVRRHGVEQGPRGSTDFKPCSETP